MLNFSWALDFSRHGGNSHIQEEVDEMYQVNEGGGRNTDEDFFIAHSDGEEDHEEQQQQQQQQQYADEVEQD